MSPFVARRDILHRDTNSVVNGAYRRLMGSHLLQNMTLVAGNRRHLDIVDNARPRASLCRLRSGSSRCIIPAITAAHKPQGKPQMEMETAAGPTVAVAAPQLAATAVSKRFGGVRAVENVTLEVTR